MEFAILAEGEVAPDAVNGDADDLSVELGEFGAKFVVEAELIAANGAPISGVKDEDDGLSAELGEGNFLIGGAGEGEIWSGCAGGQGIHGWVLRGERGGLSCGTMMRRVIGIVDFVRLE